MIISFVHPEIDEPDNEFYRKTLITQSHNTQNGEIKKYIKYYTADEKHRILSNDLIIEFLRNYYGESLN